MVLYSVSLIILGYYAHYIYFLKNLKTEKRYAKKTERKKHKNGCNR